LCAISSNSCGIISYIRKLCAISTNSCGIITYFHKLNHHSSKLLLHPSSNSFYYTNFCPQLPQKFAPPVFVPQFGQKFGAALSPDDCLFCWPLPVCCCCCLVSSLELPALV